MLKSIFCLYTFFSLVYPIEPLYLNNLCDNSDLIIEAQIIGDSIYESQDDIYAESILKVDRIIKGELIEKNIKITYSPQWSCPEGPSLLKGKSVIAFMKKRDEKYFIYGLSYGTKYHDSERLRNEYINRITKYLSITNESGVDSSKIVDWLIENLEYQSTSSETISIISNSLRNEELDTQDNDRNSLMYKANVFPITRVWNDDHKTIIREKILNNELSSRRYSWKLLCYLYKGSDARFENLMIEQIPEYLENEYYHGLKEIIETLQFEDQKLVDLKNRISIVPARRENYSELKNLILEFKEILDK